MDGALAHSEQTMWMVLPAYNEERSLPPLLERFVPLATSLPQHGRRLELIVVDDGSSDATVARAEAFRSKLSLRVERHARNQNLGAALRTGLNLAIGLAGDADVIATMDADNTHDPALLTRMWSCLDDTSADVVIASRYAPGGQEVGLTRLRRTLSRGASFMLSVVAPVAGARDYTCGYRLYRASMLRRAREAWGNRLIEETGFTCMAELLLKLGRGGSRIEEVPLVLRYDLKEGASKMKVLRTIGRYFVLARRVLSSPIPRLDP